MTLTQRVSSILEQCFAYLHPCLYGAVGGGAAADIVAISTSLEREIAYLMPDADPRKVVDVFVRRLPDVRKILETDVQEAYEGEA